MNRHELRAWLADKNQADEVWQMTGTREYCIGEPGEDDGEAEYISTVGALLSEVTDEA